MASRKKKLEHAPLEFEECRSLGHEWRKGSPLGVDDETSTITRPGFVGSSVGIPSTCQNCGTERVRWITRSGESVIRYRHPDGYSRKGDDKLTAREWRSMYVATLFEQFHQNVTPIRRKRKAAG